VNEQFAPCAVRDDRKLLDSRRNFDFLGHVKRSEKIILLAYGLMAVIFALKWPHLHAAAVEHSRFFDQRNGGVYFNSRVGFFKDSVYIGLAAVITLSIWLRHRAGWAFRIVCALIVLWFVFIGIRFLILTAADWSNFSFSGNFAEFIIPAFFVGYPVALCLALWQQSKLSLWFGRFFILGVSILLGVFVSYEIHGRWNVNHEVRITVLQIWLAAYAIGNVVAAFIPSRLAARLGFILHLGCFLVICLVFLTRSNSIDSLLGYLALGGAFIAVLCFRVYDLRREQEQKVTPSPATPKPESP
jgi:hypothetical protein